MSTKSLQNGAKRPQINAERSKMPPKLMQNAANDPKLMQNAAKRPQIVAERSFSREWAHSLENEPQIAAERSKTTPKLMQNATKRPRINAEQSKTAPN